MSRIKAFASSVMDAVNRRMFGMDQVIRLCLMALYTGGHVLLEGNPGLGKTELVKTLGSVLCLPFGRIQFTPDLMPADITGTYIPDFHHPGTSPLKFQKGPVFTSLLLADEINRATPKTQSAMLEAMAERQVTVLGEIKPLQEPFMVLATQNPIDHEGTYNLPEAQADRFMFKILMPVPGAETLRRILHKCTGITSQTESQTKPEPPPKGLLPKNAEESIKIYASLLRHIQHVVPAPLLEVHVLNMFLASNGRFDEVEEMDSKQKDRILRLVDQLMLYGMGPRASIALLNGAKANALLFSSGENHAGPADLAPVVIPCLRHRIKLDLDWQYRYRQMIRNDLAQPSQLKEKMLTDFCLNTAPKKFEYRTTLMANQRIGQLAKGEQWA